MRVSKTFLWYSRHAAEIKRYAGHHVAIVSDGIAAVGKTAEEAYKLAKKKYPGREPALTYIPKADILVL